VVSDRRIGVVPPKHFSHELRSAIISQQQHSAVSSFYRVSSSICVTVDICFAAELNLSEMDALNMRPPAFIRTPSGMPMCAECQQPAGTCDHTGKLVP